MPSTFTERYRKWVPRHVRRAILSSDLDEAAKKAALEEAKKVYFKEIDLSETYGPFEPAEGHDVVVWSPTAPWKADSEPHIVIRFGFWLVTGAAKVQPLDGTEGKIIEAGKGVLTNEPAIVIEVGIDSDVVATAWYYDDSSNAKNLQIDAFSVDLDDFINDDFVEVVEPHTSLTADANKLGLVPTGTDTGVAENVVVYRQIGDNPFLLWDPKFVADTDPQDDKEIYVNTEYSNGGAQGRALTAKYHSNGIAWAFYRSPYELDIPNKNRKAEPDPPPPFWHIWQMFSVLGSVVTAGLGAGTLYLFQTASAASRPLLALAGASLAAAIGYVMPRVVLNTFRRS